MAITAFMTITSRRLQRHALQFEWAWQHPEKSHLCKPIYEAWQRRGLRSADAQVQPSLPPTLLAFNMSFLKVLPLNVQVKLAAEMLNLAPFCMYPLTVQVLSVKFAPLWEGVLALYPYVNQYLRCLRVFHLAWASSTSRLLNVSKCNMKVTLS